MKRSAPALLLAVLLALSVRGTSFSQDAKDDPKDPDKLTLDKNEDLPGAGVGDGEKLYVKRDVQELLELWAKRLGESLTVDPQLAGTKIEVDPSVDWGTFREILSFHDVVCEERNVNGKWALFAHVRRNISCRAAPPFRVLGPNEPVVRRDELVTAFIQVKNGAGNDIFATVRGLLIRDVNRIGNILYVRGPELIILSDFASNVEYYRKVIAQLDVPPPSLALETRVFALSNAPADEMVKTVFAFLGGDKTVRVVADARTNRLVVKATKEQLDEVAALLPQLDVAAPAKR